MSPVFSIDAETGELTVDGRDPYLDANGTSGMLNVCVIKNNNHDLYIRD